VKGDDENIQDSRPPVIFLELGTGARNWEEIREGAKVI
jgi:hypothetical protein